MLSPRTRQKFRKQQRGVACLRFATRGNTIALVSCTLQGQNVADHIPGQIEASRRAMNPLTSSGGARIWIRIFPDKTGPPLRPAETTDGLRKGNPEGLGGRDQTGRILFEIGGLRFTEAIAKQAIASGPVQSLPVQNKFIGQAEMANRS